MSLYTHPEFDGHENVMYFHEPTNDWKAVIAIHSTVLGSALGGCRMFPYVNEDAMLTDALRLSRGMTYKSAVAGLDLGGGKMVVWADPKKDKTRDLLLWIGECVQLLDGLYLTGEDMGMRPEDIDVLGCTTEYALGGTEGSGDPSLMTARGVRLSLLKSLEYTYPTTSYEDIIVAIQGVGAVGSKLARLLHADGFSMVVADADPEKAATLLDELPDITVVDWHEIHKVTADVFAPCAIGGVLNEHTLWDVQAKTVCGSANNQLATRSDGFALWDRGILYIPDFVANAGGLCNVAGEMAPGGYDESLVWPYINKIPETVGFIIEESRRRMCPPEEVAIARAKSRIVAKGTR